MSLSDCVNVRRSPYQPPGIHQIHTVASSCRQTFLYWEHSACKDPCNVSEAVKWHWVTHTFLHTCTYKLRWHSNLTAAETQSSSARIKFNLLTDNRLRRVNNGASAHQVTSESVGSRATVLRCRHLPPALHTQRVNPAPLSPEKYYLFIITAASQQRLRTQKPLGDDWVPDIFWLNARLPDVKNNNNGEQFGEKNCWVRFFTLIKTD